MHWLDAVIIIVIAVSTFIGLKTGLIKSVLSLAGLIVGVILAGRYYVFLSERLTFVPQAGLAKVAAFAIILIGVMVVAGLLALLLKVLVSMMMLGWANYLGGAIFGLLMGVVTCSALLIVWVKFQGMSGAITESLIATTLLGYFPVGLTLLPDEFGTIRSFF